MANHASSKISKVLVANRGEIAVRVIRAAKDAGLASVAVYAEPDADAPHVRLADEAFALGGQTSAESYLVFDKILDAAAKSGANAIHPGYGFLSENADFAQAVLDAGLIWIGPSPQSIRDLGDKVTARHIAAKANAPLVPGTPDPVKDADEILAFAKEHGLPIAIKAAFGGGGRGMKVARTLEEIPELFESATREATAASDAWLAANLPAPPRALPGAVRPAPLNVTHRPWLRRFLLGTALLVLFTALGALQSVIQVLLLAGIAAHRTREAGVAWIGVALVAGAPLLAATGAAGSAVRDALSVTTCSAGPNPPGSSAP